MCSGSTPPACKRSITCCAPARHPAGGGGAPRSQFAFRSPPCRPLASSPEAAQYATTIVPQPLVKAVARWLRGIFHAPRSSGTADLATLIHENRRQPVFVQEFFRRIVDDGLVVQTNIGKRHYDLRAIRARHYTETVTLN